MDYLSISAAALSLIGAGAAATYAFACCMPLSALVVAQEHGRFAGLARPDPDRLPHQLSDSSPPARAEC
jgi:hypothetical protein